MLRVKICGIRRMEDAVLAADLGAWGVGFVFWPGSPRFIDPFRAKKICASLPPWVVPVGVFVDQPDDYVSAVASLVQLGAVQLHGNESLETVERLPHRVIKSVAVTENFDETTIDRFPRRAGVLLDAHDPNRRGGTGKTIDWTRAAAAARRRKVLLAGGLCPENVRAAVEAVRPFGIDVSSGVEASPGVKDHDRMRALFAAVGE
ncbi:MAG: phosphoribosylanthranilate isomerase [Vicinamibacterales bacterium]